jgi:hypothetical protein
MNVMRLRRCVLLFVLVGILVLPLIRTGEVQLVTIALIALLATALHRANAEGH